MIIKIKKGKHLSSQITKPRFGLFNNGQVVCKVTFTDSCKYTLTDGDQEDWNKLSCGASWGFFPLVKQYMAHENSSRWGWRYLPDSNIFQITPYFYSDGVRNYAETLGIEPINIGHGQEVELIIKPYETYVKYIVKVSGLEVFNEMFKQNIPSINGWNAVAFFGGNKPAPNDIEYELNYL